MISVIAAFRLADSNVRSDLRVSIAVLAFFFKDRQKLFQHEMIIGKMLAVRQR
jgi:hypothetical protein